MKIKNEEINKQILEIWKKYPQEIRGEYMPLLYPKFNEEAELLFIGCNPSFREGAEEYIPKFDEIDENKITELIKGEGKRRQKDSNDNYFREMVKLSEEVGMPWNHLDLFYYRETKQNEFKKKLLKLNKKRIIFENFDAFAKEQFEFSIRLINKIKPKIIIVANAFASDLVKNYFKLGREKFSNEYGCYFIEKTPIFFSSMLSGGHLDKYSRERLVWHIKGTLKNIK
ncbi:MAG: hypothetical protein WC511_04325 [Candidatus Pacearchaeota archaeon]|jgi:hypothetical protein